MKQRKLRLEALSVAVLLALNPPATVMAANAETDGQVCVEQNTETELPEEMQSQEEETVIPDEEEEQPGEEAVLPDEDREQPEEEIQKPQEEIQETPLPGTAGEPDEEILSGTADIPEADGTQMFSGIMELASDNNTTAQEALNKAETYMKNKVTSPVVDSIGGEWAVMGMARYNTLSQSAKIAYLTNLYQLLEEKGGVLSKVKYTEYSRVSMALTSIGINPGEANGYNLLKPLADFKAVNAQGINGTIFALIALDTKKYEIPALSQEELAKGRVQTTRDNLIAEILSKEAAGGGWSLQGKTADPDVTSMALQALAPYRDRADVKPYVNRGIEKLKAMQDTQGGFASEADTSGKPVKNLESTAQVVIALSAIDPNLITSDSFMKNGKTLLDELLRFQLPDGSFAHLDTVPLETNQMATEQGTLALIAWCRAADGQNRLYDMTDVPDSQENTEESAENVENFRKKLEALPVQVTIADKETVHTLKTELSLMKKFGEKEAFSGILNEKAAEIARQEETVAALDEKIWNQLDPLNITQKDKAAVDALYAEYQALLEPDKNFVKNRTDLLNAVKIIEKLEKGILAQEIFENVKTSQKNYLYEGKDYTIRLKGKNKYNPADMDAGIEIAPKSDSLSFTTGAAGTLPGEVEVSIKCTLPEGIYMLWKSENGSEKRIQWTAVSDGYMSCDLTQGGSYILKKEKLGASEEEKQEENSQKEENKTTQSQNTSSATKKPTAATTTTKKTTTASTTKTTAAKTASSSNTVKAEVKNGVVEKKTFEEVKGKDKNLKIQGETGKDKPFTMTVNGKDIKTAADMKAGIQEGSPYGEDIRKLSDDPYIFRFEQNGKFPGQTQVELTVDCKDGDYLLLRYDAKERKAEYVQKVEVKDKKTKFIVSEGGDYFIAKKAKSKSLNEIEAEEKEQFKDETGKEETEPKTTDKAEQPEDEGELILSGTKDESKSPAGTIAAVLAAIAGLGAAGGGAWWYIKKRK